MSQTTPPYARSLRTGGLMVAAGLLVGCPQLLDDEFGVSDGVALGGSLITTSAGAGGVGAGGSSPLGGAGGLGEAGSGAVGGGAGAGAGGLDASPPPTEVPDAWVPPPSLDAAPSIVPLRDAGSDAAPADSLETGPPAPTCTDGVENQDELAVDCGGVCLSCPVSAVLHRYTFSGVGTSVVDSAGGSAGVVVGTTLSGTGEVDLDGTGDFVNLPNGVISSSRSATVETWLTWRGGPAWQRIFDFGVSTLGETQRQYGFQYLALSPRSDTDKMVVVHTLDGQDSEVRLAGLTIMPSNRLVHIAVVVDNAAVRLRLYVDGALNNSTFLSTDLTQLDDVNNWVGLSQYAADAPLDARLTELRIYDTALDTAAIARSFVAGPDALLP